MSSSDKLNDKKTIDEFNKKVVSATQHLYAYVKHRLYIAESTGIIPKNMYKSQDIIDEGIAKFYEAGYNIDADATSIKLSLFKIVDAELDALFKKEKFHQQTISTHSILQDELDGLVEKFTVDEDFDLIMNEELSDISYKQDDESKHVFVYDDNNNSITNALELSDLSSTRNKHLLGKIYTWLPLKVSDIVDLFVFGKLSFEEIAKVKAIEEKRVERILKLVIEDFKAHLD
jgi:DNA-directed RNA polymerase specialized sigma24 family protein